MSMLRVLLVEDERAAARTLQQMLQECQPATEVLALLNSVRSTAQWLTEHPAPDLIFMDIHLADGTCFELFKRTTVSSPVIFTTAYDQHALEAFRSNGIDYLLKPLALPDVQRSLAKFDALRQPRPVPPIPPDLSELLRTMQLLQSPAPATYRSSWLGTFKNKLVPVAAEQVAYFSIRHGAVTLTTLDGQRYLLDVASLDELEAEVDPRQFFRGNRQILFAKRSIADLEPYYNHRLLVNLTPAPSEEVVISKPRVSELKAWLSAR